MAGVIVSFKVMPKDTDVSIEKIALKIKQAIDPEKIYKEEVGFGIVALHVTKIIPDEEGVLQLTEDKLRAIEDVGEVEVVEITRSL